MTPAQARFVELERKKEEYKKLLEDLDEVLLEVIEEIGMNGHFQDSEGIVYQVVEPKGTFVSFKKIGYERTRRLTEKKGSLSMKKAQELGYTLVK